MKNLNLENRKPREIKNMYSEKYHKHSIVLSEEALPKIFGLEVHGGYINEQGVDIIDGEKRNYLVLKLYADEI